jgi:putative toxin-antitoxin system antitoxin component (TIGR02293 family)
MPSNLYESLKKEQIGTVRELNVLENGISVILVDRIAEYLDISVNQLVNYLRISRSTWHRRKKVGKLDFNLSDRVLQLLKILEYAETVFGNMEKVRLWFNVPSVVFENRRPVDLIGSLSGLYLINDELLRIEHGIFI